MTISPPPSPEAASQTALSPPSASPHTTTPPSAPPLTATQATELLAELSRLGLLTSLLSRVLTALESPGGEVSQRLQAMMDDLSGIALALEASATALTAVSTGMGVAAQAAATEAASRDERLVAMAAGQERLAGEMVAMREEMHEAAQREARRRAAQAAREETLMHRLDQAIAWLGAPMTPAKPTTSAAPDRGPGRGPTPEVSPGGTRGG